MSKIKTKGSAVNPVDTPTVLPELPIVDLTPLEPSKPVYYVVAKLDARRVVIGMYTTKYQEYDTNDFKVRQGTTFNYGELFDMLGKPNYKIVDAPIFANRPVLDENGEQMYEEQMQEFPVFEKVPVTCPDGHLLYDELGNLVTESRQVFDTIVDEFGIEHSIPRVELLPVQVALTEKYQVGTKEVLVKRTLEEKSKDLASTDIQVKSLTQTDANLVLSQAQQNMEMQSQKTTDANLLLEIAKLKAQISQLQGGVR